LQCLISNNGFTLIELIVAVLIGAIALTVLYASFFQIIKAKDSAEGELELYHEARVIFSKMTEDLQAAYPRGMVYSDSSNFPPSFFMGKKEGNQSLVSFTSLSRDPSLNPRDSDQAEISYYVEPIPESDLFFLMRRENPRIGIDGGTQYAISERIVSFNLLYITDTGEESVDEWDSTQTRSLPKAVQVILTMRSPRGEDIIFNSLILIPVAN
jgi:general secretion pathway protein J